VTQIKNAFTEARDSSNALAMRRYMRDRFDFVGLKRPHYRNIIRPLFTTFLRELAPVEIKAVVKDLWAQSEREFQYVAIDLLIRISNRLQAADLTLIDQR
jgi:3-methyladenine DNA glycosylase AlkD